MKKIVHFSSVHQRYDIRIFLKECVTLAQHGYDVTFVVADGLGNEVKQGVNIIDAGKPAGNRLARMFFSTKKVYRMASNLRADIYHFHDPELIHIGLKIKSKFPGSKVIFDSHENYADDISEKPYIPKYFRALIAAAYKYYEKKSIRKLDGIIAATPSINHHFCNAGAKSIDINNYPFVDELNFNSIEQHSKQYDIIYIGAISEIRGVSFLVDACALGSQKSMAIAGTFANKAIEEKLKTSMGWSCVDYFGQVNRETIAKLLSQSRVAAVTFLPAPNHIESQPNKMFEYMSAGLPIVASNFPLWKEIIEDNNCGICVNPESAKDISQALEQLLSNPNLMLEMGKNARQAVIEKYNWSSESNKLLKFYQSILAE
ncbi:MAG: glycosyltransferase family 4 protein [Thiofilum sp.]|uniref:glycosyltransferase family 4 protein n=1 Tax=Thiofilum sp. TaxID=2212733 RepID=UPI0025D5E2B2|nr:glycosyltransferase family 4 protein [Thiofilum sp.]MBK8453862.1 glycosyltransferase family 4 protein [Thiofilum sp.]